MEIYNKHYIRLDSNSCVIKGFSDAFEQPFETDICITENGGRHFELNGIINPSLATLEGIYLYKYVDNTIIAKTEDEIKAEVEAKDSQPQPPTLEERLKSAEEAITALMGV